MDSSEARAILRLRGRPGPADLRRAFREAAKHAHPDRRDGDAERFRQVVEAFRVLQELEHSGRTPAVPTLSPESPRETVSILAIPPMVAMAGGSTEHTLGDGRTLRLSLPPGLRAGDRVRAGGLLLEVVIRGDGQMMVRGDDLWIEAPVDPEILARGGRLALETPLGRRIVSITPRAGARGLVRLVGQGLPARGQRPAGHLFLRLAPVVRRTDSAARSLLRRFAAAWAA